MLDSIINSSKLGIVNMLRKFSLTKVDKHFIGIVFLSGV